MNYYTEIELWDEVKELHQTIVHMMRWMPEGFGKYPDEKELYKKIRKSYDFNRDHK